MFGRRQATPAFRPSAPAGRGRAPTRVQLTSMLAGLVLIVAGIAIASFVVKPSKARSFDLLYGSTAINDDRSPVVIDLASGKPTVRLRNAFTSVSARVSGNLVVVPLAGGNTLMLNPTTGEFNMIDSTGFLVRPVGGGVRLPKSSSTRSTAVPSGSSAYLLQSGPTGTSVYLVGQSTVSAVSTLSTAKGTDAKPTARAYAQLGSPLADTTTPAASANASLWLLTGAGATHAITELTVPAGSNNGATLAQQHFGSVSGTAAVEAATVKSDGSGGDVAAVATADSIQIFSGGNVERLPVPVGDGVNRILAASNAQGRLVFLYQTALGWSQVSAPTTGGGAVEVTPLAGITSQANLITPAESDGRLYTMDTASSAAGQVDLWQIDADGTARPVPGVPHYPQLASEKPGVTTAEIIARGSRVIFNARAKYEAVVVFTDGSHNARVIDKRSAVQVDPSGVTALTDSHGRIKPTPGKSANTSNPPKAAPRPAQAINDKIDCKTTTQTPHVPVLNIGDRAARSIALTWSYPLLATTDCAPTTYKVSVTTLTKDAPAAPPDATVTGTNGWTVTGLFPATRYRITVTAYLKGRGTSSAPLFALTDFEGPAAPTDVRVTATSSGDWTVAWNSCGGIDQGCVQSKTWDVIPQFCDGRGLSNVPPATSLVGDPTVHSFSITYPGGDAVLGRALCFEVEGISPDGTGGTNSALTAPVQSWSPPIASAFKLSASQPASVAFGSSTSTSVDLDLGANPVRDVGGVGGVITFQLTGPDATKTNAVTFDGKSDRISTSFSGIRAGAKYTALATVSPPKHADAAVSIPPVTVTTRANWPALSATADCATSGGAVVVSCSLTARIAGISSAGAGGERFSLTDNSQVVCGSSAFPLSKQDFDPANDSVTSGNIDLFAFSGICTVTLGLVEDAGTQSPQVFGGTTSPSITTTVDLGHASTLDAGQGDFSAVWSTRGGSSGLLSYTGPRSDAQVDQLTGQWAEQLLAPDGSSCGAAGNQPSSAGIFIGVDPASCVNEQGAENGWQVTVSYSDKGTNTKHSFTYPLNGTPPGYIPCTVSADNFAAAWASDQTDAVTVTFDPAGSQIDGCSNWQFTVLDASQNDCGDVATHPGSITIPITNACSFSGPYLVQAGYRDPAGRGHQLSITVTGSRPQPAPPPQPPTTPPPPSTDTPQPPPTTS